MLPIFAQNDFAKKLIFLTISPEVVIKDLEEREGVPSVRVLEPEDGVHVNSEQRPEELTVLHQEVTEPSERLEKWNLVWTDPGITWFSTKLVYASQKL